MFLNEPIYKYIIEIQVAYRNVSEKVQKREA